MMPSREDAWKVGAIALAFVMAGCSESSPFRFSNLRRAEVAQGPKPAPGLFITNPPSTAQNNFDEKLKPATFVPDRDGLKPPVDPAPQMMEHPLRVLYHRAAERHAKMDSYVFRLKRREVVNGKKQPEEVIRVQLRRQPLSVHLVWLNDANKGREVIWVQGRHDNKLQVLLAPSDPFALLGRRHSIALDDPMVKSNCRYPASERWSR
jgi:hypothetical protein